MSRNTLKEETARSTHLPVAFEVQIIFGLTCALQEAMQKLSECAELWEEGGHFVEVVKRHSDIFGVSAHVDDLRADTNTTDLRSTLGEIITIR